jgi:hypothetical protein
MKILRIGLLTATVMALLWSGWVLFQRHIALRDWEARRDRAANPAPSAQFNRIYGGSDLKILNFYATRERTEVKSWLLCYGVLNAKSVQIEPPVAGVYPSLGKCVEVRPEKETRYTLTAQDSTGRTISKSLVLPLEPNPEAAPEKAHGSQ